MGDLLSDDFDVDALLEAQSSNDDESDLPELERSLDDILNDTEFDDVLGYTGYVESLSEDSRGDEKKASSNFRSDGRAAVEREKDAPGDARNGAVHLNGEKLEIGGNFESSGVEQFALAGNKSPTIADDLTITFLEDASRTSSSVTELETSTSTVRSEIPSQNADTSQTPTPETFESKKVATVSGNHGVPEFSGRSLSLPAVSNIVPEQSGKLRYSTRPGAAYAAAVAASRQPRSQHFSAAARLGKSTLQTTTSPNVVETDPARGEAFASLSHSTRSSAEEHEYFVNTKDETDVDQENFHGSKSGDINDRRIDFGDESRNVSGQGGIEWSTDAEDTKDIRDLREVVKNLSALVSQIDEHPESSISKIDERPKSSNFSDAAEESSDDEEVSAPGDIIRTSSGEVSQDESSSSALDVNREFTSSAGHSAFETESLASTLQNVRPVVEADHRGHELTDEASFKNWMVPVEKASSETEDKVEEATNLDLRIDSRHRDAVQQAIDEVERSEMKLASMEKIAMQEADEKPKLTAFQVAEEKERNAASSGLNWEEGAVAQPMRLEGIQRGAPAIGLLQVDSGGSMGHALESPALRREHGVPQAIAVHSNYIAIGFSKGGIIVTPSKYSATQSADESDSKPYVLATPGTEKSVSSMCFNQQGDLLLVGYANGLLVIWDVPKANVFKTVDKEHSCAVVHTLFLGHDVPGSRNFKVITSDAKGLTQLHTFTVVPIVRRYTVNSVVILDGQRTGIVLAVSALLPEEGSQAVGASSSTMQGSSVPMNLSAVMGVVGGATGSDVGRKFLYDGAPPSSEESLVVFATHQVALVVRLSRSVEVCARFSKPEGIREGSIPYTVWRRAKLKAKLPVSNVGLVPPLNRSGAENPAANTSLGDEDAKSSEITQNVEDASLEGATTGRGDGGGSCPSLAVAWDRKVFIYQLPMPKSELRRVAEWDLASPAVGVAWLEEEMLAVVTSNDQLCLFTNEGVEIERQPLGAEHVGTGTFIYHTHFMNLYGNPEKAFHNSLAVRGAALYLLGSDRLWRARLLPWRDRIKALENAGDWMGAFHIAMELYDGRSQGVTGLPRGLEAMREAIMPTLLALLSAYIDEAFEYLSLALGPKSSTQVTKIAPEPITKEEFTAQTQDLSAPKVVNGGEMSAQENMVQAREQYARVGGVAIEFCVHVRKTEVLFENVFSKFEAVGQRGTFLELLEPYILKDMLSGLAPEVMQALVEHYSSRGWLNRVEQCVLHMDIGSLDFNQVVLVCRDHGLYSALIYLFTKGLDDFKSPLEELLAVAQTSLDRSQANMFGYKLLVYLKYCFAGLAFPPGSGLLAPSRMPNLRKDLLGYILSPVQTSDQNVGSDKKLYPRLRYLLKLDTEACLLVLGAAFPEQGPIGVGNRDWVCPSSLSAAEASAADRQLRLQSGLSNLPTIEDMKAGLDLAQETVDAIIHIYLASGRETDVDPTSVVPNDTWPSREESGLMLEFVAHFAAGKYANVTDTIMPHILNHLTSPPAGASRQNIDQLKRTSQPIQKQREDLMVALLIGVPKSTWDPERTLQLAQNSSYWQVTALLFTQKGDQAAALGSYLKDASRPQHPFRFISQMLSTSELSGQSLASFKDTVISRLPVLVELNTISTVRIVLKHLSGENQRILKQLTPHPKLLFNYLKAVMNIRTNNLDILSSEQEGDISIEKQAEPGEQTIRKDESGASDLVVENPSVLEPQVTLAGLLQRSGLEFTDELTETFVELLCRFEPGSVLKFLERYENYRPDNCLKLCQEYGITDAAAFLLERVGDVAGALSLVLADVPTSLQEMDKALSLFCRPMENDSYDAVRSQFMSSIEVAGVRSILSAAVALCQRYTFPTPQESESLWFRLLDRFVEPLHNLKKMKSSKKHYSRKAADGTKQDQLWWKSPNKKIIGNDLACRLFRDALVNFIGDIVNGMIGYVPLPVIMNKILEDHRGHEFGDFKGTILDMLGEYGYERTILGTAKQLIEDDAFQNISALKRAFTHAFSPSDWTCAICERRLDEPGLETTGTPTRTPPTSTHQPNGKASGQSSSSRTNRPHAGIRIFPCGHATHLSCVDGVSGSEISHSRSRPTCPICAHEIKTVDFKWRSVDQSLLKTGFVEVGTGKKGPEDLLYSSDRGVMHRTYQILGQSRLQLLKNLEKDGELHDLGMPLKLNLAPSFVRNKRGNPSRRGSSRQANLARSSLATSSKSKF